MEEVERPDVEAKDQCDEYYLSQAFSKGVAFTKQPLDSKTIKLMAKIGSEQVRVDSTEVVVSSSEVVTYATTEDTAVSNMESMFAKCKELALNKEFHPALINDHVFCPFLVLCLDSNSDKDVFRALEIFHLLAISSEITVSLGKVLHFFDGLKAAAGNTKLSNEVREFALLVCSIVRKAQQPQLRAQPGNEQILSNKVDQGSAHKKCENSCRPRGNGKRNQSVSKGKGVELYVPLCIFKEKRLRMTEALLTLNGIISITYDMKKCYCLIRAKSYIPNELFGKAIANLGFECHLISKNENEEVMTLMTPDPQLGNSNRIYDKENLSRGRTSPQYLSDSEAETSLEEPQAVARVKASGKDKKGWLTSAADFFQKSFYW